LADIVFFSFLTSNSGFLLTCSDVIESDNEVIIAITQRKDETFACSTVTVQRTQNDRGANVLMTRAYTGAQSSGGFRIFRGGEGVTLGTRRKLRVIWAYGIILCMWA